MMVKVLSSNSRSRSRNDRLGLQIPRWLVDYVDLGHEMNSRSSPCLSSLIRMELFLCAVQTAEWSSYGALEGRVSI